MKISDGEAEELIEHIEREVWTLTERRGILDLMKQWRADVDAGRPREIKIRTSQSSQPDAVSGRPRQERTKTAEFIGKEEFSKAEQLEMLIITLGVAFITPHRMAQRLLDTIATCDQREKESEEVERDLIVYMKDATYDGDAETGLSISNETIRQSKEATKKLAALLTEISEQIELSSPQFQEQ